MELLGYTRWEVTIMFETIGTLFTIAFWAAAIFLFLGGIILCIGNLISGDGWDKFVSCIAAILGVIVFIRVYVWLESIAFCLLASGLVLGLVRVPKPGEESTPQRERKYGISEAFLDAYIEEKVIEEAVTNAIRKSKE